MSEQDSVIDTKIELNIVKRGLEETGYTVESFFSKASKLSPDLRNALLGALAGLSPILLVQDFNRDQVANSWDTTFGRTLAIELKNIKTVLPINTAAINAIAKNIYIRRNTINMSRLANAAYNFAYPSISGIDNDADLLQRCHYEIAKKWMNVGDIPTGGPKLLEAIKEIAFTSKRSYNSPIPLEDLTRDCYDFLSVARWVINSDTYLFDERFNKVFTTLFLSDILPSHYGNPLGINCNNDSITDITGVEWPSDILHLLHLIKEYKWIS